MTDPDLSFRLDLFELLVMSGAGVVLLVTVFKLLLCGRESERPYKHPPQRFQRASHDHRASVTYSGEESTDAEP